MSDPVATPPPAPPPTPGISGALPYAGIASAAMGLIGSLAGAGWSGVIALAILGLGLPLALGKLVGLLNGWVDGRDRDRAGSDAGTTAVDMANQGREVSTGLDQMEKGTPPTDGITK